jgi:hypothetical protein
VSRKTSAGGVKKTFLFEHRPKEEYIDHLNIDHLPLKNGAKPLKIVNGK